jgi:hypothetical protein
MHSYTTFSRTLPMEEQRSNDLEEVNKTLMFFSRQEQQQPIRGPNLAYARFLITSYRSEFEKYMAKGESEKLPRATELILPIFEKFAPKITHEEVHEVLRLSFKYMLLNDMEINFFVAMANKVITKDIVIPVELADTARFGYLFHHETLVGKRLGSDSFAQALVISLLMALAIKDKHNAEEREMFLSVFANILSKEFLAAYTEFELKYRDKLASFSLLELNDTHKELAKKAKELPKRYGTFVMEAAEYFTIPTKKHQKFEITFEDPLDSLLNF